MVAAVMEEGSEVDKRAVEFLIESDEANKAKASRWHDGKCGANEPQQGRQEGAVT